MADHQPYLGKADKMYLPSLLLTKFYKPKPYRTGSRNLNFSSPSPNTSDHPRDWGITGSGDGTISPEGKSLRDQLFSMPETWDTQHLFEQMNECRKEWTTFLWNGLKSVSMWAAGGPSLLNHILFSLLILSVLSPYNSSLLVSVHHWAY